MLLSERKACVLYERRLSRLNNTPDNNQLSMWGTNKVKWEFIDFFMSEWKKEQAEREKYINDNKTLTRVHKLIGTK